MPSLAARGSLVELLNMGASCQKTCVDGYDPEPPPMQLQAAFFPQRGTAPCKQCTKTPAKMAIVKTLEWWKRISKLRQELMSRALLEHALLSHGYLHQGSALRLLVLRAFPKNSRRACAWMEGEHRLCTSDEVG